MKCRMLWGLAGAAALLFLLAANSGIALAKDKRSGKSQACRSLMVGTYLASILDSDGAFASRAVIAFHHDGTLAVVDSNQASGVPDTAFSSQLGSYACTGPRSAVASTLDFGFPGDGDIGRLDFVVQVTPARTIEGEITLNILTPLETCNPFEAAKTCSLEFQGDFSFTSLRVPPQPD